MTRERDRIVAQRWSRGQKQKRTPVSRRRVRACGPALPRDRQSVSLSTLADSGFFVLVLLPVVAVGAGFSLRMASPRLSGGLPVMAALRSVNGMFWFFDASSAAM